jgi:hypothetical protein
MRVPSLLLSASLSTAATIRRQTDNTTCTNPVKRVEWRTLGAEVQKQYVDAVLCLKTKPSGIGLDSSRYDDFPYVHTKLDTSSACLLIPFTLSCLRLHGLTPRIQFTRWPCSFPGTDCSFKYTKILSGIADTLAPCRK